MADEQPAQREFALMSFDDADAEVQRQIDNLHELEAEEQRDYGPNPSTKAYNIAVWRRVGLEDAQRIYRQAWGSTPVTHDEDGARK